MKDEDGRVTIPHYYDGVKLTERERAILTAVPDDETALLKRLGIAKPEKVGGNLQEAVQYPSLNIRGISRRPSAKKRRISSLRRPSPSLICAPRRAPARPIWWR
jgi:hypothetical protein